MLIPSHKWFNTFCFRRLSSWTGLCKHFLSEPVYKVQYRCPSSVGKVDTPLGTVQHVTKITSVYLCIDCSICCHLSFCKDSCYSTFVDGSSTVISIRYSYLRVLRYLFKLSWCLFVIRIQDGIKESLNQYSDTLIKGRI